MTRLTILNDIVSSDFEESLRFQKSWGIQIVDLRNIYGKSLIQLTDEEAKQVVETVTAKGMSVYCLSFGLMYGDIEVGEEQFRKEHSVHVSRAIELARIFKPSVVRLLSAHSSKRSNFTNSMEYIREYHPWVIPAYREAVDAIAAAGFKSTIENEVKGNLLASPEEILDFFRILNRYEETSFTFDVQNLWFMGVFPTLEVYRQLAPIIGYYHLKGGVANNDENQLKWQSSLEDASWPVVDMTRKVIEDGRCEAICLNPSHGEKNIQYDDRDIHKNNVEFLKRSIPELF